MRDRWQSPVVIAAAQIIGTAVAVYLVGRLGRVTAVPSGQLITLWTSSGIALAAWLALGHWVAPGVWLGSFLLELAKPFGPPATHASAGAAPFAAIVATATVLQAGAGAWVLRRALGKVPTLDRLKEVLALLTWGSLISTVLGAAARAACRLGDPQGILNWPALQADGCAEVMGILVFAPLALVLLTAKPRAFGRPRLLRLLESVTLFLVLPFFVTQLSADSHTDLGVIVITVTSLWAALRFGKIGTGTMLACIALILAGNVKSQSPLVGSIRTGANAAGDAQLLLATFCITFWILVAILDERERAAKALRDNEARFRQFSDGMSHIIWMMTPDKQRILYVNRAFERIFGRKPEELYAAKNVWLAAIHPDDRKRVTDSWAGHDVSREYCDEYRVVHVDGTVRWLRETSLPLRDEQGEISMFGGTAEDITQSRQVAHELARQQSELLHVSRLSSVGQMVATLSHEVAQPMSAIGTFATVCAKQLETDSSESAVQPEKLKQCIDGIAAENQRCRLILRRLRDYTRKTPSRRILCDLNAVLRESTDLILHDLRRLDIKVHCDLNPSTPLVSADPIQLQQVIINLLTNARDAMLPVDASRRVVVLRSRPQGESVMIEVADQGIGLPTEDGVRIFEPFFTTKAEGMGIGLSICKTIVEEHGGEIHAFPNDSGGATFRILLPISDPIAQEQNSILQTA
jgi:PAS domain S-box-containing protein